MYCGKCGKEIFDNSDSFCTVCGSERIEENSSATDYEEKVENYDYIQNSKMKWYNFYVYFGLPTYVILSIILMIAVYTDSKLMYSIDPSSFLLCFLLDLSIVTFAFVNFMYLKTFSKFGYRMTLLFLIFECIYNPIYAIFITYGGFESMFDVAIFLLLFAFMLSFWFYPNYVYFRKRKHLFYN